MSKRILGAILVIIGAITMTINVSFFKEAEWYDMVRWISYAVFLIGLFMIPQYSKLKRDN